MSVGSSVSIECTELTPCSGICTGLRKGLFLKLVGQMHSSLEGVWRGIGQWCGSRWVPTASAQQLPHCSNLWHRLSFVVRLSSAWKRQLVAHPMDPMRKGMRGTGGTTMHGLPAEGEPGSSGGKLSLPRGWNRCHADLQKQMSRKHQVH